MRLISKSSLMMTFALSAAVMACGDDDGDNGGNGGGGTAGCTDPTADNFNPMATTNDGSCVFRGCTNMMASNFDPDATEDDGSCVFGGCTDMMATNFSATATEDDGSCSYNVTFSVNMTGVAGFDPANGVAVTVSDGMTYELMDEDSDSVWTADVPLVSGDYFYRALINSDPTQLEEVPLACNDNPSGEFPERGFTVADAPLTIPSVPFGACAPLTGTLVVDDLWFASGFIGDNMSITDDTTGCQSRAGDARGQCHAITYTESGMGFGGIFWQFPDGNFTMGDQGRVLDSNINVLRFYAWSANGGETVTFIAGSDIDAYKVSETIVLTNTPTQYSIFYDNPGTTVATPFSWTIDAGAGSGTTTAFFVDDIVVENTTEISDGAEANAADGDVQRVGDGAPSVGDLVGALGRVGYFNNDPAPGSAYVFGIPLSSKLRQDDVISAASLRIRLFGKIGAPSFGVNLVGLGTRATPEIQAADYASDNAGTLIQENILTDANATQTLVTTSAAAEPALAAFLNAQLQGGAVPGNFVFFRLEPNAANPNGGELLYQVNSANEGFPDAKPLLSFTADCTTCTPYASGCTSANAKNFDAAALIDDGSCLFDVTFTVDVGCPDPDHPITSVQITGPFCSFCVDAQMADMGNNIWSVTREIQEGDFEYKFITNGTFDNQENLIDDAQNGEMCAPVTNFADFANRLAAVNNDNTTFASIYGNCETDCFEVGLVSYPGNANDARVGAGGGTPVVESVGTGAIEVGDIAAQPTAMVIPVEIPAIPMGGFSAADFEVSIVNVQNNPAWSVDLYGLPSRSASTVVGDDFFAGPDDATNGVVKLVDNFLTAASTGKVRTDRAASAAIAGYVNDQVTNNGAQAGDFLFFRLSPDDTNVGGAIILVFASDTPPEAPTLRLR